VVFQFGEAGLYSPALVIEPDEFDCGHVCVEHAGDQPIGLLAPRRAGADRDPGGDHPDVDRSDPG
jgi:hypothetical protein